MRQLLRMTAGLGRTVVALLAIITALFAYQIPGLKVQISAESMLQRHSAAWDYFASTVQTFGSEDVVIVVLHDAELFVPAKLDRVRAALRELQGLAFVSDTSSLFDAPNLKSVDGVIHTRPFLDPPPQSPAVTASLLADATRNPLVVDNLVSRNGTTMAVNLYLHPSAVDPGFDRRVTDAIERIIAPLRNDFADVFQIGAAAMRADLTDRIRSDQRVYLPLAATVLLLSLALTLRRANAALIPLCTAGLSVVWTLGFLALVDIPVNIMTSIVPALVIIIGSTEDIHLFTEYSAGIRANLDRRAAIARMADKMGLAVVLTFMTTYLGFLSFALSDIALIYQFGLAASTGLLFNFVITIAIVPILLDRFGHTRTLSHGKRATELAFQRWAVGSMLWSRRHRGMVFAGATALAGLSLAAATQLRISDSYLDYLGEQSTLRAQADRVHEDLSGVHTFSIIVDAGIDNSFLQVKYLREVERLQARIDRLGVFDRSFSFADFVKLLHGVMSDDLDHEDRLPASDDVLREYLLFIKPDSVSAYVSPTYDRARILVRHNITSSDRLNAAVTELQELVSREADPALRIEVTGKSILSNRAVAEMAWGQMRSLALIGCVIFGIVAILFVSVRAGVIALIPNLFPVITLFGVMGIAGIPLNAGTSMIAAIALGICVDDTMHVMSRFHEELRTRKSRKGALTAMLRAESTPIFATSIALAAGFLVFATSSFEPVVAFGVLSAMVMLVALLATFILTPLLLSSAELLTVWDLLSCRLQNEALRGSPLFAGMYVWQIKKLLLASEVRRFAAGQLIIEEGTEGAEMYVVLEGSVEARKRRDDGSVDHLRLMRSGDLFGEVAPLSGCRRTADVVAREDCRVLILSWRRIERLTHLYPILAFRLFRNLTGIIGRRLTQTSEYRIRGAEDAAATNDPAAP
ncbi:MAG: MMPL family transporter [Gammaproteobacteria bacterium]|nr:MMPL family transporter [Gammaproteobacteria bacterium]